MSIRTSLFATIALLGSSVALSADMAGMNMEKMAGAPVEKPQIHRAVGVVKTVDAAKGSITLSHEPVATLKWPAMTMGFKASKEQIASVKPGDRVSFEFVSKGMDATITAIAKSR